jgi:polyhydroxybutyrate depolymerase
VLLAAACCLAACVRSEPGRETEAPGATPVPPEASAGCNAEPRAALAAARGEITVDGERRTYLIDAPASVSGDPRPVVLAFHGFKGDAVDLRKGLALYDLARAARAVVVHPEGHDGVRLLDTVGRGWDIYPSEQRDTHFVAALLDRLERTRCVDRRRVFATGFSNGGFFANLLGCTLAGRLAAVAPVAGAVALPSCPTEPAVAVLLMHGRADPIVAPDQVRAARDWWAKRQGCEGSVPVDGCTYYRGCRADVGYCEGPQTHRWPEGASTRIWQFFQAHPRPLPPHAGTAVAPPATAGTARLPGEGPTHAPPWPGSNPGATASEAPAAAGKRALGTPQLPGGGTLEAADNPC